MKKHVSRPFNTFSQSSVSTEDSCPQTSFMGHLICFQKIFQPQDLEVVKVLELLTEIVADASLIPTMSSKIQNFIKYRET